MKLSLMIAAVSVIVFFVWPEIDIIMAALFYDAQSASWPLQKPLNVISKNLRYPLILGMLMILGIWFYNYKWRRNIAGLTGGKTLFLVLCLGVGSGLIVNSLFKENWGRARPKHITQFSGDKIFTKPFIITDQCKRNCSFVSGDASVGFFIMAFAFIYRFSLWWGIAAGSLLGVMRMAQGAHFFSDVIFAGLILYWVCWMLDRLLLQDVPLGTSCGASFK